MNHTGHAPRPYPTCRTLWLTAAALLLPMTGCPGDDAPTRGAPTRPGAILPGKSGHKPPDAASRAPTTAGQATTSPTAAAFTQQFMAAARTLNPPLKLRSTAPLQVEALSPKGEPLEELSLKNARRDCRATLNRAEVIGILRSSDELCATIVKKHARVLAELVKRRKELPAPTRDNIRMVVYDKRVAAPRMATWGSPLVGNLMKYFVINQPDYYTTVSPKELTGLSKDRAELEKLALANMRTAFGPLRHKPVQTVQRGAIGALSQLMSSTPSRIYRLDTSTRKASSDSFDAARILLHDLWAPLAGVVAGDLLLAIPTRDVALFTGTEEPLGPLQLQYKAVQMFKHNPRPVTPQLFKWTTDGWVLHRVAKEKKKKKTGKRP